MRNILFLFFLSCFSIYLNSQVTIGSNLEPIKGAILDLKQFLPNENNETSNKGLLLPRVELKKLKGDLSMSLGLTKTIDGTSHIGLMVYNIPNLECPLLHLGAYTWNGYSWDFIGSDNPNKNHSSYDEKKDGTGILTDYEGNQYTTKRFKDTVNVTSYNKVWMTQNLRSLKDANGEWINCPGGVPLNPAFHIDSISRPSILVTTKIPEGTVEAYTYRGKSKENQLYKDFSVEFGLFYTQEQRNSVCPEGWHLPTQAEWQGLLAVMGDNAVNKMKAYPGEKFGPVGYLPDGVLVRTWGTFTEETNGFNLLPAGYVETPANGYKGHNFAQSAQLWAADARLGIGYSSTSIQFSTSNTGLYLSIRCVKND